MAPWLFGYSAAAAVLGPLWLRPEGSGYLGMVAYFFVGALISPPIWALAFVSVYVAREARARETAEREAARRLPPSPGGHGETFSSTGH